MIEFRENTKNKISAIYSPSDKIQKDRKMVYQRYTDMKNGRYINGRSLEELWDKWIKQYESWRPDRGEDDWQSNIIPPFTTTIVERALAEIVGQTIRPKVTPRGQEDKDKAKLMNYIVDYTWEIGDGDTQLEDSLKQLLVLGKTVWQEDYYIDKREVKVLTKFDPEKKIEEYKTDTIFDFNDVYGEKVDLRDFFIDPLARTINRGRYKAKDCIRRYIMDYDAFIETFKDSIWDTEKATDYVKAGVASDYYQFYQPPKGISSNEVEVLFYWARIPDKLIIIANDVVIRDGPNPYAHKQLPFAEGSDVKRLDGFWARGEPELLESIQDELTTLRRMRIDRQHMDIFKQFIVSNRELLDDDDAIIHPSTFIPVDDPASVKTLEYKDINPSAYQEEALLKEDGRNVTGVMNPQPSGTATEAAIFKESTMKTLQKKVWSLSRELMTDILRLRVPNIVQYYTAPNIERILGEGEESLRQIVTRGKQLKIGADGGLMEEDSKDDNFFTVRPDLIKPRHGGYDLKLSAEPTFPLSKPLLQEKIGEFMMHPVIQAAVEIGYYDVSKLADRLSEVNDFDPDDFRSQENQQQQGTVDPAQMMELANRENQAFLEGKALSGTPYATSEHTEIHLAFMDSDQFKQALAQNDEIAQNISKHVLEEDAARKMRGEGTPQGTLGQPRKSVGEGIMAGTAKASNPAKVVGSEMLPKGING